MGESDYQTVKVRVARDPSKAQSIGTAVRTRDCDMSLARRRGGSKDLSREGGCSFKVGELRGNVDFYKCPSVRVRGCDDPCPKLELKHELELELISLII